MGDRSRSGGGLHVLLVEDDPLDGHLVTHLLESEGAGFRVERAETLAAALAVLERNTDGAAASPDVVLLDLTLPDARGLEGLERVLGSRPDLPVVILSGITDEEMAVRAVAGAAQDYLMKGRIDGPLLTRALRYAVERQRLVRELREALARVRTLSGLLPICASCKNVRDDDGYWQAVEVYVQRHSDAAFSHALCPSCARTLYPDLMADWSGDPVGGPAPDEDGASDG